MLRNIYVYIKYITIGSDELNIIKQNLDKIATCDTDWNDRPLQPQVMKTVTVETFDVDYDEPEIL